MHRRSKIDFDGSSVWWRRASTANRAGTDSWHTQTECVLESIGVPRLTVRVRWLQLQRRTVERAAGADEWIGCDRVVVDGREIQTWDEAVPQEVTVADLGIDDLCLREHSRAIGVPGAIETEIVRDFRGAAQRPDHS